MWSPFVDKIWIAALIGRGLEGDDVEALGQRLCWKYWKVRCWFHKSKGIFIGELDAQGAAIDAVLWQVCVRGDRSDSAQKLARPMEGCTLREETWGSQLSR